MKLRRKQIMEETTILIFNLVLFEKKNKEMNNL